MNRLKNKRYILLLLVLMTIGISYAYWNYNEKQNDFNVAKTNCFSLTYTDNTDAITLDNMVPTEDEEGLKEKGYSFTIKNTCNTIATYEVNLEDLLASQNVKQFPNQYIKISLNDGTPKVLNTYEKEASITKKDYQVLLTLLNPFAPHITEELNEKYELGEVLCKSTWPTYDISKLENNTFTMIVQVNGKLRGKIEVSSDTKEEEMKSLAFDIDNVKAFTDGKEIIKVVVVPKKLVNIVVK